jgi:hypothetical protein
MVEQLKRVITIDQILRPQTQLELIFDVDLLNDSIDLRTATVLDVSAERILITQAAPPVTKALVGRSPEATFVQRDPVTGDVIRWGWKTQIKEIIGNYKLRPDDAQTIAAVAISRPSPDGLTRANARMDYRLSVTGDRKISIQTHPSFGRVSLLDFSAGGALIAIPVPPQAQVGMKLWFTIFFPVLNEAGQQTTINGEAEVRRVGLEEGEQMANVGLKCLGLDLSATRALQKVINHYMLEEQRGRARPGSAPGGGPPSGGGLD